MPTLELAAEAARELKARRAARASTAGLYQYLFPQFDLAPFHIRMGREIDGFVHGKTPRLIINLPPGHIKSYMASITAPAFYLGHYPSSPIIAASYGTDLARDFGREVRDIVAGSDYQNVFPGVMLRKDSKAAGRWHTRQGGIYYAAGTNKAITGRRARRAIIDDPHEDYTQGLDLRITSKVWAWYTKKLYTRLVRDSGIAIIMQRMSTHDLTARVLELAKKKGEVWKVVTLPAITDRRTGQAMHFDGTMDGPEGIGNMRQHGVALWPEGYPLETLLDIAATVGAGEFNAMYQQIPDMLSGNIIKEAWMRTWGDRGTMAEGRVLLPTVFDQVIQSWDLAVKEKEVASGSYVVGQVWGRKGPDRFLLDQFRAQVGFDDTCKAMINLTARWPKARKKLVEDKANGPAAESKLRKKISGLTLVEPLGGDKAARLRATESEWSTGHVFLPPAELHPWVNGYRTRLLEFPKEPNDEGDATSQALNWWAMNPDVLSALSKE